MTTPRNSKIRKSLVSENNFDSENSSSNVNSVVRRTITEAQEGYEKPKSTMYIRDKRGEAKDW